MAPYKKLEADLLLVGRDTKIHLTIPVGYKHITSLVFPTVWLAMEISASCSVSSLFPFFQLSSKLICYQISILIFSSVQAITLIFFFCSDSGEINLIDLEFKFPVSFFAIFKQTQNFTEQTKIEKKKFNKKIFK
jgi:hypothetical protein